VPEGNQVHQLGVRAAPDVVAATAIGFLEQLGEALGAPRRKDGTVHRKHPHSLGSADERGRASERFVTVTAGRPAVGRTRTNVTDRAELR
jgi:hypothetical protein